MTNALGNRLRVDTAAQGLSAAQKTNAATNLGLDQVNNTSDANKPISSATQTALNAKAPLASPTFTGTVSAPVVLAPTLAYDSETFAVDGVTAYHYGLKWTATTSTSAYGVAALLSGFGGVIFYTAGVEQMRLSSAGSLGLGTIPSSWGGAVPRAFELQYGVALAAQSNANSAHLCVNCYYDGVNWRYKGGGIASRLVVNPDGISGMTLFTAASGASGAVVTWAQPLTVTADGNVGIGGSPSSSERLYMLTNNGQQCVIRLGQYTQRDWYVGLPASSPNFAITDASSGQQRLTIDTNGNLLVGVTNGVNHMIRKATSEGNIVLTVDNNAVTSAVWFGVGVAGWNGSATAHQVGKNSSTGRSINAGGTINASGADYAEYMTKADDCGAIAKGAIVGVDATGKLTDKWASAVSFLIKSTDPSYVGGDVWGSEESLGVSMPTRPTLELPGYTGAPDPGAAPQMPTDEDDPYYEERLAAYGVAHDLYVVAQQQYEADQAAHVKQVQDAQHQFDTVTLPAYEATLAEFNAALEAARQKVDRIAYCGQVPVNVTGAKPGDYIIPVQDGQGIKGVPMNVGLLTFTLYAKAVGIVQNILPDGRANVRVKPV
jgi:hypothetical protein